MGDLLHRHVWVGVGEAIASARGSQQCRQEILAANKSLLLPSSHGRQRNSQGSLAPGPDKLQPA